MGSFHVTKCSIWWFWFHHAWLNWYLWLTLTKFRATRLSMHRCADVANIMRAQWCGTCCWCGTFSCGSICGDDVSSCSSSGSFTLLSALLKEEGERERDYRYEHSSRYWEFLPFHHTQRWTTPVCVGPLHQNTYKDKCTVAAISTIHHNLAPCTLACLWTANHIKPVKGITPTAIEWGFFPRQQTLVTRRGHDTVYLQWRQLLDYNSIQWTKTTAMHAQTVQVYMYAKACNVAMYLVVVLSHRLSLSNYHWSWAGSCDTQRLSVI